MKHLPIPCNSKCTDIASMPPLTGIHMLLHVGIELNCDVFKKVAFENFFRFLCGQLFEKHIQFKTCLPVFLLGYIQAFATPTGHVTNKLTKLDGVNIKTFPVFIC